MPEPAGPSRTVWLLRHAKAVPDPPPGGRDRDRVLARRGEHDADALGALLASGPARRDAGLPAGATPQVVLCSSAARTAQTAERVVASLAPPPEVRRLSVLYNADPDDVVDQLRLLDDEVTSVMVVGHNPTTQLLATALLGPGTRTSGSGPQALRMPTAGLAVCSAPIAQWSDLTLGSARLLAHAAPPY